MKLSPAQEVLLRELRELGGVYPALVSGRRYQTALALERRGLASVRYQGPSRGWVLLAACSLEVAYGGPGPVRYCTSRAYREGWCIDHLLEFGKISEVEYLALEGKY